MSTTVLDLAARNLADATRAIDKLRTENEQLRRQLPVQAPRLGELVPGTALTSEQISALDREQRAGRLDAQPLREVIETDRTGRRTSRFYGDPGACWNMFSGRLRAVVGINLRGAQ